MQSGSQISGRNVSAKGRSVAGMNTESTTTAITPFTLEIPQAELDDLRERLARTRWPDASAPDDWTSGMPVAYGRELAEYWRDGFDWRAQEARLNRIPQFSTAIDGHELHSFHRASARPDARPLLLLHGWPGSSTEFAGVIDELADPTDPAAPAFHVVAPSLPGFGIGGPATGWEPQRAAEAFVVLMRRLGYERYVVHGYDTGALIGRRMGLLEGSGVELFHALALFGSEGPTPDNIDHDDPAEAAALKASFRYQYELGGYALVQSARPQSVAYLGADSPVALLSWLVERYHDWSGDFAALSRDELLTTVSIYWFFGTLGSSARYYQAGGEEWAGEQPASATPTAVLRMPGDISTMVRRFVERNNTIVRWREADAGGHFGLWEAPEVVVADLRAIARHR